MPAPLQGRRIVVTRPRDQADDLARALQERGADVILAPVIRIEVEPDLEPLRAALATSPPYRWVVFTSQNAAQVVCDRLDAWGTTLGETPVAAIGPATAAALQRRGVRPALVSAEHMAEALLRDLVAQGDLRGARVLLPTAREGRDVLPLGLRGAGATVDVIPVYRTVGARGDYGRTLAMMIPTGSIDAVTFTSSSAVRHFVDLVGRDAATAPRFVTAVIGPVTAATARELGVVGSEFLEAAPYTIPVLVAALCRRFS